MSGTTRTWQEVAADALGWLHPDEGPALHHHAASVADLGPLAEIGGYAGKSACWIGSAAQEADSVLFSFDWHRGSPEMAPGRECHHPQMIGPDGRFDSLTHFRRNVADAGLEDWVVPVAGRSQRVGRWWTTPLAFLFIDGGHDDTTVMHDYQVWARHVMPGGILAFHDVPIPGIAAAVDAALGDGFTDVERVDDLMILRAGS
jgi:predicted O-methyltransferase YrrM